MEDCHRGNRTCPHTTTPDVVERILEIRKRRGWGARKIRRVLESDATIQSAPTVDTVHRILDRHGCVEHAKPRRRRTHPGPPLPFPDEPNATLTADFNGEFRTGDGHLCFPLTVQGGYTRFLLECRGMLRLDFQATIRRSATSSESSGSPSGFGLTTVTPLPPTPSDVYVRSILASSGSFRSRKRSGSAAAIGAVGTQSGFGRSTYFAFVNTIGLPPLFSIICPVAALNSNTTPPPCS